GTALAAAIIATPLPEAWWRLQVALGALVFVCAIGKALYDTLFYDRYWL
ncbi:MAG: hypothetical protein HYX89_01130, partial [Chloroflexi bacterium]|nr:hypothetical protein [Chloroflexota bacterium]